MPQLSGKQRETLEMVISFLRREQRYPTYREISEMMGSPNPSAAASRIHWLLRKGYLTKPSGMSYRVNWELARKEGFPYPVWEEGSVVESGKLISTQVETVEEVLRLMRSSDVFPTLSELAGRLGISKHAAFQRIESLERRGLLRKKEAGRMRNVKLDFSTLEEEGFPVMKWRDS